MADIKKQTLRNKKFHNYVIIIFLFFDCSKDITEGKLTKNDCRESKKTAQVVMKFSMEIKTKLFNPQ